MCEACGEVDVEKRYVIYEGIDGISGIVEFDAYCLKCGEYLYSYNYGRVVRKHIEKEISTGGL